MSPREIHPLILIKMEKYSSSAINVKIIYQDFIQLVSGFLRHDKWFTRIAFVSSINNPGGRGKEKARRW